MFSKDERYLPCSLFFAGENIVENREQYEKLTDDQKLDRLSCYYHVAEGQRYTVYQYWYYYAYNQYRLDDHEHDFECLKVFVGKRTGRPEIITCNIHSWREIAEVNGEVPEIKVEEGGHGLFYKKHRLWKWSPGLKLRIQPSESCEALRGMMMPSAPRLMDKNLKLIGNDYGGFGKRWAPQVPWARWEYYLPEETLHGLDRKPEIDLSGVRGIDRPISYVELVEIMRSKPKDLREQRKAIVKQTRDQLTYKSVYSTNSRKRIIRALSDPKVKVPKRLKQPLIKQTGSILLPQEARDLQEAVTIARQYGAVTKGQYRSLRYAGVRLKEESALKPLRWTIRLREEGDTRRGRRM